jgi:hypothetical protein
MGCCGGKPGCNRNPETTEFKFPQQEIFDSLQSISADFIGKLQEVAAAGMDAGRLLRGVSIKNAVLERLARQIADLAIENAYFKSVLNLFAPMDIGVTDSEFELRFGPNHIYSLKISVTQKNSRLEIAKQLREAAAKLEAEVVDSSVNGPDQKLFPFIELTH